MLSEEEVLRRYQEALKYPKFAYTGKYNVVDGTTLRQETGDIFVDTCVARQSGDWYEWEVLINIHPDGVVIPSGESDNSPHVYT